MSIRFTDPFVAGGKEKEAKTFKLGDVTDLTNEQVGVPIRPEEIQKIVDKNVGKANPDVNDPRGINQDKYVERSVTTNPDPDAKDPRGKDQRGTPKPGSPKALLKEAKAARKEAVKSLNVGGSTDLASGALNVVDQIKSTLEDSLNINIDIPSDLENLLGSIGGDLEKLVGAVGGDLTKLVGAIGGDLEQLAAAVGGDIEKLAKALDGDLENLIGDLTAGLSDIEKAAKGFFDNPAGAIEQMSKDLVSQLTNQSGPLFGQMAGLVQQLGGDPNQFLNDLVEAGLVKKGTTLSGLMTVPSAIQFRGSNGRNVGSDGRVSGRTNTTGGAGNQITGGQPGRTTGTRVQCAFSDARKVPRQSIIDALNAMCLQLDIVVQITPGGGWHPRSTGTRNHPTGWAADFQVVASSGGLILPTQDPVLYGRMGAILHGYAMSLGVTAGIGEYPSFLHYDTYPPRSGYSPIERYVRWGSGWNMNSYIQKAKDAGYTYKPGFVRNQIAEARPSGPGGMGGV